MVRALVAGAVLAFAVASGVRGDSSEWQAPQSGNIILPTTPNDFGSMIFSLLSEQVRVLAGQDGVETEGSPANLVATMAHFLAQAQQAFFSEAAPLSEDQQKTLEANNKAALGGKAQFDNIVPNHNYTYPFHNDTFPPGTNHNYTGPLPFISSLPDIPAPDWNGLFTNLTKKLGIANRTDPVSQDLVNLLIQDPAGPELAAAFSTLPNIPDPVSLGTSNFTGGSYGSGVNGSRQFVTFSSTLFSYKPCFFQGTEGGVSVGPQLISIAPRILQAQPQGVEVTPKLIEVAPRILVVKPLGVNVQPIDVQVSPVFISISPKVSVYHPYVPGVPGSG